MPKLASKSLEGRRIKLLKCNDANTNLKPGALGTVRLVDDVGTVHTDWDDGSTLGLCWDAGDRWQVMPTEERQKEQAMQRQSRFTWPQIIEPYSRGRRRPGWED